MFENLPTGYNTFNRGGEIVSKKKIGVKKHVPKKSFTKKVGKKIDRLIFGDQTRQQITAEILKTIAMGLLFTIIIVIFFM